MKIISSVLFLFLASLGRTSQAAPVYSVTDLGDFAGGEDYSQAFDLNAFGQVVGVGQNSTRFRGFLAGSGGDLTLVDLGSLPTLPGARGNGINSLGQVVGSSSDGDNTRAFLWNPVAANSAQGSMIELLGLPGERNHANATSINAVGQVVGYSRGQAYLWTPGAPNGTSGTAIDLGGLPGAIGSLALDINDSGQVAGISGAGVDRAFLWTPSAPNGTSGSMVDLGSLPGGSGASQGAAINAAGVVVGNSTTATGQHAVLWRPGGAGGPAVVDLGVLEGGNDFSFAFGINAANQVVGSSNSSDSDHAFLWTEAEGMLDLNTLTDATGAAWILGYATSINDQGQIVGWGTFDPDGPGEIPPVTHAFRLEPVGGTGTPTPTPTPTGTPTPTPTGTPTPTPTGTPTPTPTGTPTPTPTGTPTPTPTETPAPTATPTPTPPLTQPARLANISTRVRVLPGDNALIGGFIITGTEPKKVIIRGLGPSLVAGIQGTLADPILELHQGSVTLAQNDNWQDTQATEIAATIPPANVLESAIVQTLDPGTYTAVLRGRGETSGTGLVEVYDLQPAATSKLANISTRGVIGTGDNVMIGGLIVSGDANRSANVIVRAIGPSLGNFGVAGALSDPVLELRNGHGDLVASNDNWRSDHEAEIRATNLAPSRDGESAIIGTLVPGNYTAIMRGENSATGIGLVEVYQLE
jgi:probable HAF family extracellular repeat protein